MPQQPARALVLGPILRRVVGSRATVWVQISRPGTVEVRASDRSKPCGAARTFTSDTLLRLKVAK